MDLVREKLSMIKQKNILYICTDDITIKNEITVNIAYMIATYL